MPKKCGLMISILGGASVLVVLTRMWWSRGAHTRRSGTFASRYVEMLSNREGPSSELLVVDARVMVFYGSSSGNAEAYAKGLVANLRDRGVETALIDPSSWPHLNQYRSFKPLFPPPANGDPPIAIFLVSTTGEGEVPVNFSGLYLEMQTTVREEKDRKGEMPFKGLMYSVFSLGDTSYKYFCRAGINVSMLLKNGGGTQLLPVGFGDARNPLRDDTFEEWEEKLLDALEQQCGVTLTVGPDVPPHPQLVFRFLPDKPLDALPYTPPPSLLEPSMQFPAQLVVQGKTQRTERRDDGSYILHLVVSIEGYTVSYQAGDHLGIFPANPPDIVEAYREALHISDEEWQTPVELCSGLNSQARASLRNTLPARVTLQTVFKHYLCLSGRPRKSVLRVLARYCSDPQEKVLFMEMLRRGAKPKAEEGTVTKSISSDFSQFHTMLDYLRRFPSCCCIPTGHFVEIMPRVQPRFYSIASDMLTHPATIEVFIRILSDGMNSRYLQNISVGERITAFVSKSTFHLPVKKTERPVVMIGPGTGIASMLGFCYRRAALMKKHRDATYGPMVLFFGARGRITEYFVQHELESWGPQGEGTLVSTDALTPSVLTLFDVAFSRDQPERRHVTHLIEKHKDYLVRLLTDRAHGGCLLYVSGDASQMVKSVDRALVSALEWSGMTRRMATEFLTSMERDRSYMKDVY